MKKINQKYFRVCLRFIVILMLSMMGCDILDEFKSSPPTPEEVLVNPIDPKSSVYLKPVTTIISAPSGTATLTTAQTTIVVKGNKDAVAFSYMLDTRDWSPWDTSTSIAVTDLDEGRRTCTIRALHRDGVTIEENPPSRTFTVNAVTGPALMFLSRRKDVRRSDVFDYYVVAEEVQNLYGAKIVFTYNPSLVSINSITAGNGTNAISASAQLLTVQNNTNVRIEMFFPGSKPVNGISGTQTIATLHCSAFATGQADFLFMSDSVKYRNPGNDSIPIKRLVNGKVVVK